MRLSLSLASIYLWTSFVSGFSTRTGSPFAVTSTTTASFSPTTSSSSHRVSWMMQHDPSSSHSTPWTTRGGAAAVAAKNKKNSKTSSSTQLSATSSPIDTGSKCPVTGLAAVLGSLYGAGGVVYILVKAISRVWPIALEPFQPTGGQVVALTPIQLSAYIVTCLWFAYYEGYKGFQKSFSPLVVKRSFTLIPGKNQVQWYHFVVAPLYSMGLIHATRKRKIVSWSVTVGIAMIVAAVKRLPYPWRNIVDAGVVVGLSWGSISMVILYAKAWLTGQLPATVDAALPPPSVTESNKSKK